MLAAFADMDAPDTLELLARAPDPARAAKLTGTQVIAALKRAHCRDITGKYTASTLKDQVTTLQGQVEGDLAAPQKLRSTWPGPGFILGAQVPGDDPERYFRQGPQELRRHLPGDV